MKKLREKILKWKSEEKNYDKGSVYCEFVHVFHFILFFPIYQKTISTPPPLNPREGYSGKYTPPGLLTLYLKEYKNPCICYRLTSTCLLPVASAPPDHVYRSRGASRAELQGSQVWNIISQLDLRTSRFYFQEENI